MRPTTLLFLLLFLSVISNAQTDTEIYLFDLTTEGGKVTLSNQRNISNGVGYDSQPYFLAKNVLLFAGKVNGNTEIVRYVRGKKAVFNTPTAGGEYSPQPIPKGRAISAVRLDPDGKQRLYTYEPRKPEATVLVKDAVIAYYTWANEQTVVSADIVNDSLHLAIHNTATGISKDLGIQVGRSFHKIPNTNLISFIDKSSENWIVKSINPNSEEIKEITPLISGSEDIAWLPEGSLLATKGNTIYINIDKEWEALYTFSDIYLQKLSRICLSKDGSQIAIVSEKAQENTSE